MTETVPIWMMPTLLDAETGVGSTPADPLCKECLLYAGFKNGPRLYLCTRSSKWLVFLGGGEPHFEVWAATEVHEYIDARISPLVDSIDRLIMACLYGGARDRHVWLMRHPRLLDQRWDPQLSDFDTTEEQRYHIVQSLPGFRKALQEFVNRWQHV